MTTSEERSYYEIALTNRQVAFAIATLLLCVVGAFIAGLWVAREAIGESAPVGPTLAQNDGEEPFAFFGNDEAPESSAPESPEAGGVGPAEMPVQRVREAEPSAEVERPAEESPPTRRPEPERSASTSEPEPQDEREEQAPPEPVVVARNDPEPERTEAAQPPERAPEAVPSRGSTPPPAGSRVIQVFSSADQDQARSLLGRLEQAGYSAFMDPLDNGTRTMYRVRVGPYASEEAAKSAASELRQEFRLETWITSR